MTVPSTLVNPAPLAHLLFAKCDESCLGHSGLGDDGNAARGTPCRLNRTGGREENRLKEGGWDGEVSEKSLAMSPCGLFSYREEAELAPFPAGHRSRAG
jgi:hypothetical protein